MKVLFDGTSDYSFGPINSLNFSKLENTKTNLMFYYGIHPGYRMSRPSNFKYNIYFETEEPNGLTGAQHILRYWSPIISLSEGINLV